MIARVARGLLAGAALLGGAAPLLAQTVYRCGDSYSQSPCEGARTLQLDDARSPAQKAESDDVARRSQQAADALEADRLRSEQQARERHRAAAGPPQAARSARRDSASKTAEGPQPRKKAHAKAKAAPDYFTTTDGNARRAKNKKKSAG